MAQNVAPASSITTHKDASEVSGGTSNAQISKRLQQELMSLMMSQDKSITAFPDNDNLLSWIATVRGPPNSVYEGLTYKLKLDFPPSYPFTAPTVKFTTPCFHPNVDTQGNICLDILKEKWSALYEVRTVLLSLQSLLSEPNNDSPLNAHAAQLWSDQKAYKEYLHAKYKEQEKKL